MVKFLLQRPIAVLMAFTACFIIGLVTYFSLPVSLLPDIAIPQITIQVSGENSSARELENTVVTPVRRQLLQVAGLREIKSETRDGAGVIRMEFEFGVNTDLAFIRFVFFRQSLCTVKKLREGLTVIQIAHGAAAAVH